MLKRFSVYRISEEDEEIYERVIKLFKAGYDKFKFDKDESIIFKLEDQEEIEKYLGISIEDNDELKEFIHYHDGGEYLQIHHLQIGLDACIEKAKENFEQYEERIWQSQDYKKELNKIFKEQMYKVFIERIQDGFEIINNGNFEWN